MGQGKLSGPTSAGRACLVLGLWLAASGAYALESVTVSAVDEPRLFIADGLIEAVEQATVTAQISGRVAVVHVDINDVVAAGDVLLELTTEQQSAGAEAESTALKEARGQHQEAQANLIRVKAMYERGAIAKSAYDAAIASSKIALATVERLEASSGASRQGQGYTRILAPYAGIIAERHVAVGELVSIGQPLLAGYNLEQLRVVADLPQRIANQVMDEQPMTVVLADGNRLTSSEHLLFHHADSASHTVRLRIDLPAKRQQRLMPGAWAKVEVETGREQVLRIPRTAVLRRHELSAVYVAASEGQWQLRPVRLGDERDGQLAVLAGLDEGETIARDAYEVVTAFGGQYAP